MDTTAILAALTGLHRSVGVAIYGGNRFSSYSNRKPHWSVTLKYSEAGTEVETTASAETFEAALTEAWDRLGRVASLGLGDHALTPPLEHPVLEPPVAPVDDEVPF